MLGLRHDKYFIKSDNFFCSIDAEEWERTVEKVPGVLRFKKETIPYLSTVLSRFQTRDPYMSCPVYHAFTGRKGLWCYSRGNSFLLFSRNPDKPEQIMFYPQLGPLFPNLAIELMQMLPYPVGGYQFSRIEKESSEFLIASMNKRINKLRFSIKTEKRLDWAFPVHIVSTKAVIEKAGKKFKSFRQPINIFPQDRVRIEKIDPFRDQYELLSVVKSWAFSKKETNNPEELIEAYVSFFDIMRQSGISVEGMKFYFDKKLTAFEAWATPAKGDTIANNLAGFNKSDVRGFSEYQHYVICKELHKKGIKKICLGGSETKGLDAFKRKMNPVESVDLVSISVNRTV